jgi:hypothetical protein
MNPSDAIDGILSLVRHAKDPKAGCSELIAICSKNARASLWKLLPAVDVFRDIEEAARWLGQELRERNTTTGIYLGLDTLNMDKGRGTNVEIGGSPEAIPSENDLEWMYRCRWYGRKHLIRGLLELHETYSKEKPELFSYADYVLFLGYSGLTLAAAIESLKPSIRTGHKGRLFAWGFHDGDLFPLLRATSRGCRRLATSE